MTTLTKFVEPPLFYGQPKNFDQYFPSHPTPYMLKLFSGNQFPSNQTPPKYIHTNAINIQKVSINIYTHTHTLSQ